jgi:hypothetical protein
VQRVSASFATEGLNLEASRRIPAQLRRSSVVLCRSFLEHRHEGGCHSDCEVAVSKEVLAEDGRAVDTGAGSTQDAATMGVQLLGALLPRATLP